MSQFSYDELCEMWSKSSKRYTKELSGYCIAILPILKSVDDLENEIEKCEVYFEETDFKYGWD